MTLLYLTVDTEYSIADYRRAGPTGRGECFARSILGTTRRGSGGILYQMSVLERHGLKAVFFVDPMPALVWGVDAVADIVAPILERGHDVQLHLHTEWLEYAGDANPAGNRTGRDLKDFTADQQYRIVEYARNVLVAAGAPAPIAFRAGNYAANDDTLRVLSTLGMRYDSSHCPGIASSDCAISLGMDDRSPIEHCGAVEVPIGCIQSSAGGQRHMQLTALTCAEIVAAVRHAVRLKQPYLTLVSHSFELLSRDKTRINRIVKHRFEQLCAAIEATPGVSTATYISDPPLVKRSHDASPPLRYSLLRSLRRYVEQAVGNTLYGSR